MIQRDPIPDIEAPGKPRASGDDPARNLINDLRGL